MKVWKYYWGSTSLTYNINCIALFAKYILKFKGGIGIWSGRRDLNSSLASIIPSNTTNTTQSILKVY